LPADFLGFAPAAFEDLADLRFRAGQLALVLGEDPPGLGVGLLGRRDLVGDPMLPLVESIGDRPPGEFQRIASSTRKTTPVQIAKSLWNSSGFISAPP